MASVFLSYDHRDTVLAKPLVAVLEKAGHAVWFDRHIHGGAQYSRKIEQALNDADAVVVLWTINSLDSAWVRDEAAEGRDRNKLVPLSIGGITPPIGFRQFQTIDLGRWKGRGKLPRLADVLTAVDSHVESVSSWHSQPVGVSTTASHGPQMDMKRPPRKLIVGMAALLILLIAGFGIWRWLSASDIPVVKVAAADASSQSAEAADILFAKLGGLSQIGDGKWQLVDSKSGGGKADLLFRISETNVSGNPGGNLILLDGKRNSALWSREFAPQGGAEADLTQQMSLTAGRVLGCVLESRDQPGLSTDLLRSFLDACASLADLGGEDYGTLTDQLRKIVDRAPRFKPAWSRLMTADSAAFDAEKFEADAAERQRQLKSDAERARAIFPDLPELALADLGLRQDHNYGRAIDALSEAVRRAPDSAELFSALSEAFADVGRMGDAINSARQAAALDPLSPAGTTAYIMTLAYSGQIESARAELSKAEKLWAGTGSLRDAELAFHVRYGDPAIALKLDPEGYNTVAYYTARKDPSPANIAKLKAGIDEFRPKSVSPSQVGWAIQSLGEFGLADDVFYWLGRLPEDQVADISYILFRPSLASVRRDPRFMPLAKRIGLVGYWQKSGKWPDFCSRPGIPYDCKKSAATS